MAAPIDAVSTSVNVVSSLMVRLLTSLMAKPTLAVVAPSPLMSHTNLLQFTYDLKSVLAAAIAVILAPVMVKEKETTTKTAPKIVVGGERSSTRTLSEIAG